MTLVKDIMVKHMVAVSGKTSLGAALKLMNQARVSLLPVVESDRLIGVISRTEAEAYEGAKKAEEINLKLLFVEPRDDLDYAAKMMVENRVVRLPVVNNTDDMKCIGVVTSTEVASHHKKRIF